MTPLVLYSPVDEALFDFSCVRAHRVQRPASPMAAASAGRDPRTGTQRGAEAGCKGGQRPTATP